MANKQTNYRLQPHLTPEQEFHYYLVELANVPKELQKTRELIENHLENLVRFNPEVGE